jgi:hypothetical protein
MRLPKVRYRKSLVTYLDVLDAQRTALAAETQLVFTERTRLTDMVSLFKESAGRGLGAVTQQKPCLTLSLSMLPETWIISPWALSGTMLSAR